NRVVLQPLPADPQKSPQKPLPNQDNTQLQRRPDVGPQVKPGTSPEQNKAVVRQVFDELFSRGRYDMIEKIYAQDCVVHHNNNRPLKLEESVAEGKGWRSAAPDLKMSADQMNVDGNMVTVAWTARGTHTGRGNGLMKPTGKQILIHGSSTFRVVNGKIVEVWNNYNRNEVFRQLGVSPTMAFLYEETEGMRLAVNRMFTGPVPVPRN
ncbi:MAG TPA: ester cyclase, partial [Candidatus Saccharimonadales bacterium]|nr:ester cyclase [Candidatus Saccharimonadales bacterium]